MHCLSLTFAMAASLLARHGLAPRKADGQNTKKPDHQPPAGAETRATWAGGGAAPVGGMLMYGKEPTVREMVRWGREDRQQARHALVVHAGDGRIGRAEIEAANLGHGMPFIMGCARRRARDGRRCWGWRPARRRPPDADRLRLPAGWTRSPEQPSEGFTVLATEPVEAARRHWASYNSVSETQHALRHHRGKSPAPGPGTVWPGPPGASIQLAIDCMRTALTIE